MMAAIAFLLQLFGFASLAATMHATPAALRIAPTRRRSATWLGWTALTLSLATVLLAGWPARAMLTVAGTATVAATIVLAVVSFVRPIRVPRRAAGGARLPRS